MCSLEKNTMLETNRFDIIVQDCPSNELKVMDKLLQRSEARIVEIEKKKSEKSNVITEQTDHFNTTFQQYKREVEDKLSNAKNIHKRALSMYFDHVIKSFQKLQKLLSDSTMFLPTYDIKIAQESLKVLQDDIQKAQENLLPKKKFTFRNKLRSQNGVKDETDHMPDVEPQNVSHVPQLSSSDMRNMVGETIERQNDIDNKDVGLHQMKDCNICLKGAPSTVFISGLRGCHIFSGPVSTSVHIENCINCIFVIACQQMRVHNTSSCAFYLHVTSRIVIEDSTQLKFAPYNWTYPKQDNDFITAKLDRHINNWDLVDDFNWLVSGIPSPNWSILLDDEQSIWS